MNKRILIEIVTFALLLFLATPNINARRISIDEAKIKANSIGKPTTRTFSQSSTLSLAYQAKTSEGEPIYYVFNRSNNEGFVIVSADSGLVDIIGYSDNGNFNLDELSETFQWWLSQYDKEISDYYASLPEDVIELDDYEDYYPEIKPLLTTQWGQDYPFNNMCPMIGNYHAYAGCVPLAMAQVVNFHKWPQNGIASNRYMWYDTYLEFDFTTANFDYSVMKDVYIGEGKDSEESVREAAKLAYACGVASNAGYREDATSAMFGGAGFIDFFGYPEEGFGVLKRSYFTKEEWEDIVYEELSNQRPVNYLGESGNSGHSFVCDGYKNGLFHINWGWYGMSDGYYSLSVLRTTSSGIGGNSNNSYSANQEIVRGLRPPSKQAASPILLMEGFNYDENTKIFTISKIASASREKDADVYIQSFNYEEGTYEYHTMESLKDIPLKDKPTMTFTLDVSDWQDGNYELRPAFLNSRTGKDNYTQIYGNLRESRFVVITVKDGQIVNGEENSELDNGITFYNFYAPVPFLSDADNNSCFMTIENHGSTISSSYKICIFEKGTWNRISTQDSGYTNLQLEPGCFYEQQVFLPKKIPAGEYDMMILEGSSNIDVGEKGVYYSDRIPIKILDSSYNTNYNGLYFVRTDDGKGNPTAMLIKSKGTKYTGDIDIPETVIINGVSCKVTVIGNDSFMNTNISSVKFPDSIEAIGSNAFWSCDLGELTLPQNLRFIGSSAFSKWYKLTSLTMPPSLERLGLYAFYECNNLIDLELNENLNFIGDKAFYGAGIEKLFIPSTVEYISSEAFYRCNNLKYIISKAVTPPLLGEYVFSDYNKIVSVPEGTTESYKQDPGWSGFFDNIGVATVGIFEIDGIYYRLDEKFEAEAVPNPDGTVYILTKVTVPNTVNYNGINYPVVGIDDHTFENVPITSTLSIGSNVKRIGKYAFANTSVTVLKIPDGVEFIDEYAFYECKKISSISFPETLVEIGDYAFSGLTNFTSTLTLPSSLNTLGSHAFDGCSNVNVMVLKGSMEMGESVFSGCSSIKSIILDNNKIDEPTIHDLIDNLSSDLRFYVNPNDRDAYVQIIPNSYPLYNLVDNIETDMPASLTLKDSQPVEYKAYITDPLGDYVITAVGMNIRGEYVKATSELIDNDDPSIPVPKINKITIYPIGVGTGYVSLATRQPLPMVSKMITVKVDMPEVKVTNITISSEVTELKKGQTTVLEIKVLPDNATDKSVNWTSSDPAIVSVDSNGKVTAIEVGEAIITAVAKDGSGVSASCIINVIPVMKGDSNDDGKVTVSDAVNTANYAVGNEVEIFNFEAADVNENGMITITDALATVTIILNQDYGTTESSLATRSENFNDCLRIDNFYCEKDEEILIPVFLENHNDYVAFQADVKASDGIMVDSIIIGERAQDYHTLSTNKLKDSALRIVLFDANGSVFENINEPMFYLKVHREKEINEGYIMFENVLVSDISAQDVVLPSTRGEFEGHSNIGSLKYSDIRIAVFEGYVTIFNAIGQDIYIYSLDGSCIRTVNADTDEIKINLKKGIYFIKIGGYSAKILMK